MSHTDATSATFQQEVLDASNSMVVLVDFWAPWCGPCRAIAPVLEELSADPALEGKAKIVKVNVDENGDMAEKYNIQGIPNMKFFRNGVVVGEIVGLQPDVKTLILQEFEKHAAQPSADAE